MPSESVGALCVFAKPPRSGEVKTCLGAELGADAAAVLARAFFDDTWTAMTRLPWAEAILATTDPTAPEWRTVPAQRVWPQGDGDLGVRLERVLARALRTCPFALAVGTDSPGIPPALLEAARRSLETADAVIGPSEDGGFYVLGLRRCPPRLLRGVPWSTDTTFVHTVARLRGAGLTTTVLPAWFDVDRPDDLDLLEDLLCSGEIVAPATAHALTRLDPASSRVVPAWFRFREVSRS